MAGLFHRDNVVDYENYSVLKTSEKNKAIKQCSLHLLAVVKGFKKQGHTAHYHQI